LRGIVKRGLLFERPFDQYKARARGKRKGKGAGQDGFLAKILIYITSVVICPAGKRWF
jgi:hypothetical protein